MWNKLQQWTWVVVGVLAAIFGIYTLGGRASARQAELKVATKLNKTSEQVRHVKESIDALDDAALRERSKRWVRNK